VLPDGGIAVRNSCHLSGPALVYTRGEISAFLVGVKDGEFDDLTHGADETGCFPESANPGQAVRYKLLLQAALRAGLSTPEG
jgi:hypothetical protein